MSIFYPLLKSLVIIACRLPAHLLVMGGNVEID